MAIDPPMSPKPMIVTFHVCPFVFLDCILSETVFNVSTVLHNDIRMCVFPNEPKIPPGAINIL
jgi:hypothetical protein